MKNTLLYDLFEKLAAVRLTFLINIELGFIVLNTYTHCTLWRDLYNTREIIDQKEKKEPLTFCSEYNSYAYPFFYCVVEIILFLRYRIWSNYTN